MKGCTPGQVAIVLAGRFKGKRVVCLKNLPSGLILVTGPFKLNGVPLRRLNRAYLILTKTIVDVSKVDVTKVEDSMFRGKKLSIKKRKEFAAKEEPKRRATRSDDLLKLQKSVDTGVLASVKSVKRMGSYLSSNFTLSKNQRPHLMKF
ncbi:putative 60S ribosomal protein L6 [Blattamonas nauphoetae]|uniref:60S ribosomal protein L6 n=1 Tax=Blattamonas nauphoetae TaxID=2049346 RepID=A0ABQ9X6K2_9EUKA|nr:putative 60S ribosomal protein L6 [Blattamonas nauphoetae]